ncbi:MAG: DUF3883 domain-containing protein [Candidatus Moranbacteria bacterium]|nr:DUF3883 domain-containing protein [Candidatus Moranbacteria bacterium]
MNEIKQYKENEPKLEDFGLDVSVYGKGEEKKSEEEELIDGKIETLEKQKKKFERVVSLGSRMDTFFEYFGILLFPLSVFLAEFTYGEFEKSPSEGVLFILWFLLILFIFLKLSIYLFQGIKKLWIGCKKSEDYDYERNEIEKIETVIEKLQKRKEDISSQRLQEQKQNIQTFENSLREYWEEKMERSFSSFDDEKSYHSSNLRSIFDSVQEVNDNLLTTKIDITPYEKTIQERGNIFGEDEVSLSNESDFVRTVRNAQRENETPLAPEEKFRTPRKIDWEELNAKRKKTGLAGEEIVMNIEKKYLISINRDDLAQKVKHRSKEQGDGLGYDILSFFEDGREKYIEVKSTTGGLGSSFYLSRNELEFLESHLENAFIYKVKISLERDGEDFLQIFRAREVVASENMTPVQYLVKMKN